MPGLKSDGYSHQLPTIAIVASYDTFGAAPVCFPPFLLALHLLLKYLLRGSALLVEDFICRHCQLEVTAMEVGLWPFSK